MNGSQKRPIVYAIRDFPTDCGTHSDVSKFHLPEKPFKNPRTSLKNPSNGTSSELRNPNRRTDHVASASKPNGASSLRQETEFNPSIGASSQRREPSSGHVPTPREKVLEVRRLFKQVFAELDRDKAARRGEDSTSRIDLKTQAAIEEMGKQVNKERRIGSVPGIEVGDVFQYKTELRVVGLHSKTMCGIDYMKIGEIKLATSIVSSDGYDYDDKFVSDVLVYTGEGGNVINRRSEIEDQKLAKGNLALVNSMREKREVRVIRGQERLDKKGKHYVYDGLYFVTEYWLEKGVRGKNVFKFKLCRIPGQPPLTWK